MKARMKDKEEKSIITANIRPIHLNNEVVIHCRMVMLSL